MLSTRINARLTGVLASYVERMTGRSGLYETPSEYIRDLIRRDMAAREEKMDSESILQGYRDVASGAYMASSGNFHEDMKAFARKEKAGWS